MKLDPVFVRSQFPQAADNPDTVFCANAGGSYMSLPVLERMEHYNRHLRVQPYSGFSPSREAGQAMDAARAGWCAALNIDDEELTIGASTSLNTYVMAQAAGAAWGPGDEIVVTGQDHEANHGVWRRQAEARGALVREWPVDPVSGLLEPEALYALLNDRTRWVFFSHCSNIVGTVNPVADIVAGIRQRCAARVGVDAVAYAPHHICDLKALDVDLYYFSLYKVFGPHQGLLYIRAGLQADLQPQSHYFIQQDCRKRFNPAGPQHAQVAACAGVVDYLNSLCAHHGCTASAPLEKMAYAHSLLAAAERQLAEPLLDYLRHSSRVRLLGKHHCQDGDRVATIAFRPLHKTSAGVAAAMQAAGIGTEHGHFYAHRLLVQLGIPPDDGVVRLSLLHYNTPEEVDRILRALDSALA
jgi:cysteine desulfurase family protein (TIGR01976 family)